MVIFFNINYLEQTIAARQNLLAKCLLTVPSHLNNIEPYIHRGSLPDDKYRFPWKRGRADEDFLLEQSTRHFKDICLLQTSAHTSGLFIEPYTDTRQADNNTVDTGTRNWSEGVNFNLDCDLIPSSNPSSGLDFDFTPDDFFTDKAQFEEFFVKEDLQQFDSNKDGWKLEESVQLLHVGTNLLCHRPTLGALMARLPTEEMEDPLEDATHINKDEKQYLTGEEDGNATLQSKQHYGATIFDESFHMEPIENDHTLEVPITADSCVPCSAKLREMQAMELANLTENIPLEQDKGDVRDILATAYGTQTLLRECGFPVPLSLAREPNTSITFLDVNEIILTEKDKFIEAAVLDTPQQSPEVKQKLSLSVPDRQAMAVDNAQSLFLTREEWSVLKQSLRQNEMYYDNVQASVLPEPKIAADYPITTIRCLQRTRALCLPQPASTGQLELRLSWDIVSYTCMVANPCRHLAVMRTKAEDVERPPLAEVEAIQKYDYLNMLDWQDAIISTRSCIELKQSTVENTKNGKGIMDLARLKSTIGKQSSHSNIDATDPISWFMALRSKQSTTIGDKCPKNQQIARTGVRFPEINSKTVTSDGLNYPVKIKANFEQNTRIKHHTVKIQLSDELLVIIHLLRSQAASFMENLQQLKVLQTGSRFDTINPGQTHLLLKQREKYLTENTVDVNTDDIFKNVLSLHMLCVACDIATNCCLESAIAYMASMYEKYQGVVSGDLGNVRQHIFKIKAQFSENKISHPKISAVCKEIETWLKKKQAKSRDKEQKMLILVKREMPTLLHCLQNALGLGKLISPGILSSPLSEDVIDVLDQHNCLISPQRFVTDTFPWVQFCLVVEYERVENSPWQQLCERQNIRHMDFQMELIDLTALESLKTECKMKHPQYQITLIASQHISTNVPLLQLLEARFNILLVERNYSMFESSGHKCYFSDIDVDESTGIVQCDLADVGNDMKVQELVTKIAALSLKYMHLWVLVASLRKINSYQFPNHVIINISRLHAAVACLVHRKEDFSVTIIMCETIEEVAYYVRNISETGMETNTDRPWPEWLARKWISQDMTEKEKCFLSLPFMSSFNAQLVATYLTFAQIFAFSFDELVAKLKWIPRKILKWLNAFCNQKSGSENLQNAIAKSAIPCEENELQNESIVVKETAFKQHKTETQTSPMYNNFASKSIPASDVDFSPKNADSSWRTNCRQPDERSVPRTSCPIQHGRRKCNSPGINVFGGEAFDESHSNGSVTDQSYNGLVFDNNHGCVFEYNHGLPQNSKKTLNENPAVRHSSVGGGFSAHATGIQKHQGNALVGKISRKEFELEFPSAEEIDMAMRTERTDDSNDYRDHLQTNSISNNNLGFEIEHRNECAIALADITFDDRRVYDIPYVAYEEENAIEVGRCSRIGKLSENDAAPNWTHFTPQAVTAFTKNPSMDKLVKRFTDGAYQTDDFQKDSREMHNGTSDKKEVRFNFDSKIIDISDPSLVVSFTSSNETESAKPQLFQREIGRSMSLFLNPDIDRLTTKRGSLQPVAQTPQMRSLEDDLRETTRKLIENSQQFSRFANRTSRPKLSIGLAQPQQRQTLKMPKATEISGEQHLGNLTSNAERLRMAQSPWASENSPPMDLDYENSDIERALYPGRQSNRDIERALYPGEEDVTNRMAMTSSTPSKKRRLTYQKMPGRRGQTKLVFE